MPRLSDLYDADRRTIDPAVRDLAAKMPIPHPLHNVAYADGMIACTHAKKHARFDRCAVLASPTASTPAEPIGICPLCRTPGWNGVNLHRTSFSGCTCCGFCY